METSFAIVFWLVFFFASDDHDDDDDQNELIPQDFDKLEQMTSFFYNRNRIKFQSCYCESIL